MRKQFAKTLYQLMKKNKKIVLLTGDLGWGILDNIKKDFPDRFYNCGVAEQNMVGVACGMAHSGLIPFVYSITPFLIYRAFEFIRNDVDYDKANVKIIGTGRNRDYLDAGFSHWCEDDLEIMKLFKNIVSSWPNSNEQVKRIVKEAVKSKRPYYINLTRE